VRLWPAAALVAACLLGPLGALAATIAGTDRADTLRGTNGPDRIDGRLGDDRLLGLDGADFLEGNAGRDVVDGGPGDDRIAAQSDGARDAIACGSGKDIVNADLDDRVSGDCEVVGRQLSRDTFVDPSAQHDTQVEPSSFAWKSTMVVAFQSGRYLGGGSAARIGFAATTDGAHTWRSGFLPGLTIFSTPAGEDEAATDPVVTYDAKHGTWLIATLTASRGPDVAIRISRSQNGLAWSKPVFVVAGELDKDWLTCDNWPRSRYRGRCYLSYLDVDSNSIVTRRSVDGGLTWSQPVSPPPGPTTGRYANGAQQLVQPDGELTIVYAALYEVTAAANQVLAMHSTDGGASFTAAYPIADVVAEEVTSVRTDSLPSASVDGSGRIYVAWQDCRFSPDCANDRIVVSSSTNGLSWTAPRAATALGAGSDAFLPGLAADPRTSGARTRLAVLYHSMPEACWARASCRGVDVWLATSANAGKTWRQTRLNAESMRLDWIAGTSFGRFLGDYVSTSFVNGAAVPVYSLAAPSDGETFHQAISATVIR
jgi:hypothetical protein